MRALFKRHCVKKEKFHLGLFSVKGCSFWRILETQRLKRRTSQLPRHPLWILTGNYCCLIFSSLSVVFVLQFQRCLVNVDKTVESQTDLECVRSPVFVSRWCTVTVAGTRLLCFHKQGEWVTYILVRGRGSHLAGGAAGRRAWQTTTRF